MEGGRGAWSKSEKFPQFVEAEWGGGGGFGPPPPVTVAGTTENCALPVGERALAL